jgi:CubicO group peptidase (beta-lactamase class C family)
MNKKWFIVLGLSLILGKIHAQQSFTKTKTAEEAGFSSERLKRLDDFMQGYIEQGLAPNALTFVAKRGKIVHSKTFGYSNLENKTPLKYDDIFRIASQSKAITTVALLTLFEEGKFLLDDPISKYIPAFKNPKVLESFDKQTLEYKTRPAKHEITVHDLLTHTAGIPYDHPLDSRPEFAKIPFFNSIEKMTLEEGINLLATRPLMADPGEQYMYGLNTDVVGRLVEVLSGVSLAECLQKRIFEPMGMKDTYFYLPDSKASRLVELYSKAKSTDILTVHANNAYRNFATTGAKTYFSGGAGLLSTIEDYAKFCQMILNGGSFNNKQILGRKTIELMTRNHLDNLNIGARNDKFSLGFEIFGENGKYGDNASVGSLMWGGMYCSEFTIDPQEQIVALVFTNVHPYAHYADFVRKFRILAYQALK